ncbi:MULTISPECIES: hypothetical protein [unclassified Mycobacterium]|uniref:hypothetical protein n=1 Tax=unclassified Mycobacterium TaxID=2642494 RepID=UPI0029C6471A|nr:MULTISPECIES: hypothetical protein [unclassified Mycobacterium]
MASIHNPTTLDAPAAGIRSFAHAALLAASLVIGASAFGHTAIASADWDIEVFDNCMHNNGDEGTCCVLSDGTWGADGHCHAARILQQSPTILQQIPLGPKLGPAQPPAPPTATLGTPVR